MRFFDLLERGLARAEAAFHFLANGCLLAMLVLNIVNIAVRAVFDRGIVWIFPWTTVLFVWCTFLGFYVVYRRGSDITVDYVHDKLGARGRTAINLFADAVVLAVLAAILAVAPRVLATQVGDIELTGLSRWMLSVPLFVSSGLIVLDTLADSARALAGAPERRHAHASL